MTRVEYREVTVAVLVDEDGEYAVGEDEGVAAERYGDNVAEVDGTRGLRRVVLTVRVPLPRPIELAGEVLAAEGEGAGLTAR